METPSVQPPLYSLWGLVRYFLWLGSIGYGGPMALSGHMRRELSEKRQWIPRSDFLNGLALSSLCPGPLATQLAIYIGWFHARILGATAILIAFNLPAFLMVLTLAILYKHSIQIKWMEFAFYGVSASVLAIVIRSSYTMSKAIADNDHWLWGIFAINILITSATNIQIYWSLILSGLLVWIVKARPRFRFFSVLIFPLSLSIETITNTHILSKLFVYFAWAGTVVFGGGFAIIPFIHEGVVQNYHWLNEREFLDAIAVGVITPGPIIMIVSFIGYLVAGFKGALLATLGVLLPCYLLVIILAPHFNRIAHHEGVRAFVQGITMAVAGSIIGTIILLAKNVIIDGSTIGIFAGTSLALYLFKKIPEPTWLLVAGIMGILANILSL
jgi:chromate transporter